MDHVNLRLLPADQPPSHCTKPPKGWACTRTPGHEGPCAALPDQPPLALTISYEGEDIAYGMLGLEQEDGLMYLLLRRWQERLNMMRP
jgi:hypothetical protein